MYDVDVRQCMMYDVWWPGYLHEAARDLIDIVFITLRIHKKIGYDPKNPCT